MSITEIGKELRKLRIDRDERLLEMASRLGVSAAFISAVETGKKSPPSGFEEKVAASYDLNSEAVARLKQAADRSRKTFTLEPSSARGRDTAAMFARQVDKLSEDDLFEIQAILTKKRDVGK